MIIRLTALLPIVGGAVFVCLLARTVYGKVRAVIFAILALVPIVGLVILLVVNGKATRVLKNADIAVGLLGADLSEV